MNALPRSLVMDPAVPAADFRGAMRHLAGGVSVVTAGRGRDITGMTVTSVTSLSVDPPTLIVSINRDASSFPLIQRLGTFCVNVLNADQLDIAERFAGKGGLKGAARFAGSDWSSSLSGAPLLVDALAALDCEVRRSSSAIRTALSSVACARSEGRHATRHSLIGTASTSRLITKRMRQEWLRSACPRQGVPFPKTKANRRMPALFKNRLAAP